MLDFGWAELLLVAIVLIVVVGPKDLPRVLRTFGRTTAKMRSMAGDFRRQFDEALREAELDDVKGLADEAKKFDPRNEIKKHLSPLEEAGRDIRSGLDGATKPKSSGTKGEASESKSEASVEPKPKPAVAKPKESGKPVSKASTGKTTAQASGSGPAKTPATKAPAAKKKAPAKPASSGTKPSATAAKSTGASGKAAGTAAKPAGTAKKTNTAARGKKSVGSTS